MRKNIKDLFREGILNEQLSKIENLRFFSKIVMENEINVILFENQTYSIYLCVDEDEDELYWSGNIDFNEYIEIKSPINYREFLILYYRVMINQSGYLDGMQFELKELTSNKIYYLQLIAIASRIEVMSFN